MNLLRVTLRLAALRLAVRRLLPIAAVAMLAALPDGALAQPRSHYVEFRARPSNDIGHSVVMYGRLGRDGRPAERHFASFVPNVDGRKGMILPVYASVHASAADIHTPPITAYRRELTAVEYARARRAMARLKAREHLWHAFLFNCNQLPGEVAEAIGLRTPPSIFPPNLWVDSLRAMNSR